MTRGRQWEHVRLPLGDIRIRQEHQFRAEGLDHANLNRIKATLDAGGEARDPVRVARVGKVLYLVDGFHRLEAYRLCGRSHVPAQVATMSLPEAQEEAMRLNAQNGKPYSRKDKQRIWDTYVAAGKHLGDEGKARGSRTIAAELGQAYSHQTIRTKLKALGLELDEGTEFGGVYKPRSADEQAEADLDDLALEAEHHLSNLAGILPNLPCHERDRLLKVTKGIVEALERGDKPDMQRLLYDALPF